MRTNDKAKQPKQTKQKAEPPPLDQRPAYSIEEFSSLFGRQKNWGYRLVYLGKVKVIKPLGEMLIPRSEVERLTAEPVVYETANA
jgi:hypothetical protein